MRIKPKSSVGGGVLEQKREKLLVLGAISTRCDEATAQAIRNGEIQALNDYHRMVNAWVEAVLTAVLTRCAEELKASERWQKLATRPDEFTKALDRTAKGATTALKLLHGIPDHRPSVNEKRDQELYCLKTEHAEWSFGQLALQYSQVHRNDPISDKQAERSYKQELERARHKWERILDSARIFGESSALPPKDIYPQLPTPDVILDILTAK
jgi:hypothetical protein